MQKWICSSSEAWSHPMKHMRLVSCQTSSGTHQTRSPCAGPQTQPSSGHMLGNSSISDDGCQHAAPRAGTVVGFHLLPASLPLAFPCGTQQQNSPTASQGSLNSRSHCLGCKRALPGQSSTPSRDPSLHQQAFHSGTAAPGHEASVLNTTAHGISCL